MRKQTSTWITACFLFVVMAASARGQSSSNQITGYTPFAFVAVHPAKGVPQGPPQRKTRGRQRFAEYPTRKKALDARRRFAPAKAGKPKVTRQSKNKSGMGNKFEKHSRGTRHVHDSDHNNKKRPNRHYGIRGT
jgi:hypothetical protein